MLYNYYYPVLILQGFCLFHAYKNNNTQKWIYIILFIPLIGCIIYLYDAFYSRRNVDNLSEGVKRLVSSNYDVKQLERALKLSDTISNKIHLADAYIASGRNADALTLLNQCLTGSYANDVTLKMKKMQAHFMIGNDNEVIKIGNELYDHKEFQNADQKIALALSYQHLDQLDMAEKVYQSMNFYNCNYKHRVAYLNFLIQGNRKEEAKALAEVLKEEFDYMDGFVKKNNAPIIREFNSLFRQL